MNAIIAPASQPVVTAAPALQRVGFWSGVLTTVWSVAFVLAYAAEAVTSPPSTAWRGIEAYAASFSSVRLGPTAV